jgi:PAS domain S-box-containing protein
MGNGELTKSLSASTAFIQNSIGSHESVLQAFEQEVVSLGLRGSIALLDPDRVSLDYVSVAFPKGPIQTVLTSVSSHAGLSINGFRAPYKNVDIYRQVIDEKRSIFVETTGPVIDQLLPPAARPFLGRLLKVFGNTPGIYCPLISSGEVIGLLNMMGSALSKENVCEVSAFANHISVALDNAKLVSKLKNSEETFRSFIRQSTDGFVLVNEKGLVIEWNNAVQTITGIRLEDALGKPFWDIQYLLMPKDRRTPERYQQTKLILESVLVAGGSDRLPKEMEVTISRNDGALLLIQQSIFPVKTIKGYLLGSVIRDITDKKRIEETFRNNEKLESIGILAGGIAHDFNNLLTGIFGYIDLARSCNQQGAKEKVAENLSSAFGVFNRAKNLAQQLLTFAKGGKPVKSIVALQPLLTEVTSFALSGSSVTPRFSFPDNLWLCELDEGQFKQAIDNIVINARQAMPAGGCVFIAAENYRHANIADIVLPPGRYVKISIRDSGTGISREHMAKLFDPFFTTKHEGSGLGLATAHSIVRKHEGLIQVSSELGKGATFTIYVPASSLQADGSHAVSAIDHHGNGCVLVMDDEPYITAFCSQVLQAMGYSVECAANGEEAIELYRRHMASETPCAFVILDLTIPGGRSGEETLAELLKIDPGVVAVASSGYSESPIMADPISFGFAEKLQKPYQKTEIGETLERLFKKKQPAL